MGNGVRTAGAVELVHEFARKTNIPVLTTMNGVDLAQGDLHIGFIGTHGNRVANMILGECDLIISVGARLGIRQAGRYTINFAPKADLIRCDIDEYELSRNIKENEKKYHTDSRDFMRMLLAEDIGDYSAWKNQCLEAKKLLEDFDKQPGNFAVEKIASLLPENPVVSVDVGMNQCWCAQSLHLKGLNGRIHISGGYGTMGCGLPFAIGSSIASGKDRAFCITGDGRTVNYNSGNSGLPGDSVMDITVDKQGKSVSIVLPAPSITSFIINDVDEEYNVTTGIRKAIKQEDRNMVVEQGRAEIEDAIPELGILDDARANAVKRFTSMVEQLGFSDVNITFADEIEE